jgi:hypothetical protein
MIAFSARNRKAFRRLKAARLRLTAVGDHHHGMCILQTRQSRVVERRPRADEKCLRQSGFEQTITQPGYDSHRTAHHAQDSFAEQLLSSAG